ncbi:hypothetical protein CCP3SC1AL1_3560002 [Gammaproteobacteria bacterium]
MSLNTILATTPLTTTNFHLKATGTTIGNSLIWDNGTNVGIGNTNTSYTLDVSGTIRATGSIYGDVGFRTKSFNGYLLKNDADSGNLGGLVRRSYWAGGAALDTQIFAETGYGIYLNVNGSVTSGITITSAGNVGIGTSSPASGWPLTTKGTYGIVAQASANTSGIYMWHDGTDGLIQTSYESTGGFGAIKFLTSTTERMRITSGGSVNINGSGFSDVKFYVKGSDATSSNYAALFVNGSASNLFNIRNDGAVQVFGSLSKGSGSFRIDHPLESMTETHQLVHSFIEGPRVDLIYRGKLTLVNGKAQANIDEVSTMTEGTFEALCREVQCFTTNESGWDLVKGKVIGNIIYIESQNTNSTDEISWMVIGERKDKHIMDTDWTDDNGKVIVEPLKTNLPTIQNLQEQINILAK